MVSIDVHHAAVRHILDVPYSADKKKEREKIFNYRVVGFAERLLLGLPRKLVPRCQFPAVLQSRVSRVHWFQSRAV